MTRKRFAALILQACIAFAIVTSSFHPLMAHVVSLQTATTVAMNFSKEKALQPDNRALERPVLFRAMVKNTDTVLYIFNLPVKGFVIVSAEDEVYPILGYSSESSYGEVDEPFTLTDWLNGYSDQILFIRHEGLSGDDHIHQAWSHYTAGVFEKDPQQAEAGGVEPLLTSRWDQGAYYNALCPADGMGPGGHVWAGCVATAMAQVMYYYRYPQTGTGSSSYYHWDYGPLSANYGATTYRWNDMGNTATSKSYLAIAELLLHLGISVEMNYSTSGSGAYSSNAAQSLKNYFGYDPSLTLASKSSYSTNSWITLLKNNLDAGHPMYYHGFGSSGHAFNVDGYENSDHFHFNWGWGGSYDGYFYLSNLNPGSYSFTSGQGAIINFMPPPVVYPLYCSGTQTIDALAGSIEDGSGPILNYNNDESCTWLIQPSGITSSIDITFHRFNTEQGGDILYIYDGVDDSAPLIATISGDTLFPVVTTTGGAAYLKFVTNGTVTAPGWFLTYEGYIPVFCTNLQVFSTTNGTIDDGSGVYTYNNNTNCKYLIQPPPGNDQITVTFNNFSLEDGKDYLRIFDPTTSPSNLLATYTGHTLPADVTVYNGQMLLIFSSDDMNNDAGWEVSYTSTVGIEDHEKGRLHLYPNPASNLLVVDLPADELPSAIRILDMAGREVLGMPVITQDGKRLNFDVSSMADGIYVVKVECSSYSHQQKLIIRK